MCNQNGSEQNKSMTSGPRNLLVRAWQNGLEGAGREIRTPVPLRERAFWVYLQARALPG